MKQILSTKVRRWFASLLLTACISLGGYAATVTVDGVTYETSYPTASVTGYVGSPRDIVIPAQITVGNRSYSVTLIEDRAFANCTSLESLSIPGTVTQIGYTYDYSDTANTHNEYYYTKAGSNLPFYNCTSLKSLRFEDGAENISLAFARVLWAADYAKGLFYYCPLEEIYIGRNITHVTQIQEGYTNSSYSIYSYPEKWGYSAFYNNKTLTKVTIGDKVTTLPDYLFYGCSNLRSAKLGNSLTSIPSNCFNNCDLTIIDLPNTIKQIGSYAFASNNNLVSVDLPTSITSIGDYAFNKCTKLSGIDFPQSLKTIGAYAFEDTGMELVILPNSLSLIGTGAFKGCSVKNLVINSASNTALPSECFMNAVNLEDCIVGDNISGIGSGAFSGCVKLKNIKLGSSLRTIDDRAFANCKTLESLSIPGAVTQIGYTYDYSDTANTHNEYYYTKAGSNLPFYNCTSLKSLRFEDGAENISLAFARVLWAADYAKGLFYYCPLEEIYIGRNITHVTQIQEGYTNSSYSIYSYPEKWGYSAFYNNKTLTKVTIGDKVTTLPDYLFCGCTDLVNIVSMGLTPPTVSSKTFSLSPSSSTYILAVAYVPFGKEQTYSSAQYWADLTIKEWFYDDICAYFPIGNDEVEVAAHPTNKPESLIIPSTVSWSAGNYTVTRIAQKGFETMETLTTLTLPASVTKICEGAFKDCGKLSSITFNGQKEIGEDAFRNCGSLINLNLSDGLEIIGDNAFRNANSLTQISFKDGLKEIGNSAFMDCNALTALILPNSLSKIGDSAFENCIKLTYASLGDNLESLGISAFRNCKVLTEISIPGSTLSVGSKAFQYCATLALATLNEGTRTLGANCFDGCSELLSMTIPGSVIKIGSGSFKDCSSLSSLTFSNSENKLVIPLFTDSPLKTLRIGRDLTYSYSDSDSPFRDRTSLRRVSFTGNYVTNIYNYLLDGCTGITAITLPESLITINSHAFRNCSSLPDMIFPASLVSIGNSAFDGCSRLTQLTFNDGEESLALGVNTSMFNSAALQALYVGRNFTYDVSSYAYPEEHAPFYYQKSLTELKFSDTGCVTEIPSYFLYGAESLPELNLPQSLLSIGGSAFYGNSSLTGVTMPDNVNYAGPSAFRNCLSLESIHLSENLKTLSEYLLAGCPVLGEIIVPPSVTKISTGCFNDCSGLAALTIGDSSESISIESASTGIGMFTQNPIKDLYIGRNLSYSVTEDAGYSPFKNISALEAVRFSQSGNITKVGDYLLQGCDNVKSFLLPESLTGIGRYAFADMSNLEFCVIPNTVTSLGEAAFCNDVALESVTLSNNLSLLEKKLFFGCKALDNLTIPASVKEIKNESFTGCESMKNLKLLNDTEIMTVGVKDDSNSLFADCPLEELYLGRWLTYDVNVKSTAPFYAQTNLSKLTLGETVGTIGKYLFSGCSSLNNVAVPDGVESIGEESFYMCAALSNLTLGEGLSSIGERAFAFNTSLDNVMMPSTLTALSDGCFSGCTALTNLVLDANLGTIGPRSFENCSSLVSVDIPAKVYGLGVEAFKGCSSLSLIAIPEGSISSIGARAFQNCNNVNWISLAKNVTSLGVNCFDGCDKVTHIKSYNPIPPVGAPGFSQNVLDNGTVFVPAESVAEYEDSDAWWEFFQIRPFTDAKLVTSIVLDRNTVAIRDCEEAVLSATALPSDATDTGVLYRTSDTSIASVDNDGRIVGHAPGEVVITAYAADGSGVYAICDVTVSPTLVERIEGDEVFSLKIGRKAIIPTKVYPENATSQNLEWRSNNTSVIVVDEEGRVSTVNKGVAIVSATATDGSGVTYSCQVTVIPPTVGDSNDNDEVTITDAVNTANYAVGNEVADFCFEGADVNGDNRITLADASGTVTIILDQPSDESSAMSKVKGVGSENKVDFLLMEDYAIEKGGKTTIPVSLENTIDYVALQADITVPEGMRIEGVKIGNRADATHSLMQKRLDSRTMRVVLFDLNNNVFADISEPVFEIVVSAEKANQGVMEIRNIIASDCHANEYTLTSRGSRFSDASGAEMNTVSDIRIEAAAGVISILNGEGCEIAVYSENGITLHRSVADADRVDIAVETGVYVVTAGSKTVKVIVK